MKLSLITLCSVLALTSGAMAYTSKTESQMQTECSAKWKGDAAKVKSCLNGKKGYQAKMTKSGTTTSAMSKESAVTTKKVHAMDDSKMMQKSTSQKSMDDSKKM